MLSRLLPFLRLQPLPKLPMHAGQLENDLSSILREEDVFPPTMPGHPDDVPADFNAGPAGAEANA